VSLDAIARQVVEDVGTAIAVSQATVEVEPLPTVAGDATQLRVLLQNLVSNSLKLRVEPFGRRCHPVSDCPPVQHGCRRARPHCSLWLSSLRRCDAGQATESAWSPPP
jgi:hypothetical protein